MGGGRVPSLPLLRASVLTNNGLKEEEEGEGEGRVGAKSNEGGKFSSSFFLGIYAMTSIAFSLRGVVLTNKPNTFSLKDRLPKT